MPQFDAGAVVEPLKCKLRPYADFEDVIPEPSDKQVGAFLKGLKEVMTDAREIGAGEVAGTDLDATLKALDALDPDKFVEIADRMAGLHAALCGEETRPDGTLVPGRPSKAQILAVPLRRRLLFYNWLQGEVLSPEAEPGGGNAQAARLP